MRPAPIKTSKITDWTASGEYRNPSGVILIFHRSRLTAILKWKGDVKSHRVFWRREQRRNSRRRAKIQWWRSSKRYANRAALSAGRGKWATKNHYIRKKKVNKQLKTTVLWTDFFNVNQFEKEKENGTFLHCVRGLRRWWCVSHDSSKSRSPDASAKFPSCRIKGESISIRHSLDESTIPPIQVQVEIVNQNQDVIEITQLP